jgi:hypothetical protein
MSRHRSLDQGPAAVRFPRSLPDIGGDGTIVMLLGAARQMLQQQQLSSMPCTVLHSLRSIEAVTSASRELTETVPKTHEDHPVIRVRPSALLTAGDLGRQLLHRRPQLSPGVLRPIAACRSFFGISPTLPCTTCSVPLRSSRTSATVPVAYSPR